MSICLELKPIENTKGPGNSCTKMAPDKTDLIWSEVFYFKILMNTWASHVLEDFKEGVPKHEIECTTLWCSDSRSCLCIVFYQHKGSIHPFSPLRLPFTPENWNCSQSHREFNSSFAGSCVSLSKYLDVSDPCPQPVLKGFGHCSP